MARAPDDRILSQESDDERGAIDLVPRDMDVGHSPILAQRQYVGVPVRSLQAVE